MTGARPMVAHSDHVTPSSSVEHCSADKTESTRGYPNLDRYPNLDTGGIAKKKMLLLA